MTAHPFPGASITTRFGAPNAINGAPHTGTDYAYGGSSCGRAVYAPQAGIARRAENVGGGHGVLVDAGGGVEWGAWHLSRQAIVTGQRVREGQLIGYAGASGSMVTGCHLHLELKVSGRPVDPAPVLGGAAIATPPAQMLDDQPAAFPRDPGEACPTGYRAGTVNPRGAGWIPGSPWFGRPTNADGTVNACVRADVEPGDNLALPGSILDGVLAQLLPIAANGAVIVVALILGWTGVKQVLGIGGLPIPIVLPRR